MASAPVAASAASPIELTARVLVEQRQAAADGTTRIVLVPPARVTPGDAIVYTLIYRNTGSQPVPDLVVASPVPGNLLYAGPAEKAAVPEVSVDGKAFAPLAQLRVDGRPAIAADVRALRWRIAAPLTGGAAGQVAFRAIVK
ncbi:hypothetical protein [Sphingomonas gellani]|nr:hypothetical protein [Sphingomonas gellani]